jgi:hypothetical protein
MYLIIFPSLGFPAQVSLTDARAQLTRAREVSQRILDFPLPTDDSQGGLDLHILTTDIPRLFAHLPYFQDAARLEQIGAILRKVTVFTKRQYQQGFHELYGLLFYQFDTERVQSADSDLFDFLLDGRFVAHDALAAFLGLLEWLGYFYEDARLFLVPDLLDSIDSGYKNDVSQWFTAKLSDKFYKILFSTVYTDPGDLTRLWSRIFVCFPNPAFLDRILTALFVGVRERFYRKGETENAEDIFMLKRGAATVDEVLALTAKMAVDGPFWEENRAGNGREAFEAICTARCESVVRMMLERGMGKWEKEAEMADGLALPTQIALNALPVFWSE